MSHTPESTTKAAAIRIAETLATAIRSVRVFRLWHPQAPVEPVACVFRD